MPLQKCAVKNCCRAQRDLDLSITEQLKQPHLVKTTVASVSPFREPVMKSLVMNGVSL